MKTNEMVALMRSVKGKHTSDFPAEVNFAIAEAANSAILEIRQEAWLTVHEGLRGFEHSVIERYLGWTNSLYEDFENELFICIAQNLKRWNPEKGEIVTYFRPIFEKACMRERNKTSTFSSLHYETVHRDISRATETLAKDGVMNPTLDEIYSQMLAMGFTHSLATVKKTFSQMVETVSLDGGWKNGADDISGELVDNKKMPWDLIKDYAEEEEIENALEAGVEESQLDNIICRMYSPQVMDAIDKMRPENRKFLKMECLFYAGQRNGSKRKRMTSKELRIQVERQYKKAGVRWVKKKRDEAEKDFLHCMKEIRKPKKSYSEMFEDSLVKEAAVAAAN